MWGNILTHIGMHHTNSVATLALVDNGKVKGAMDESVRVSEIDIIAVWKQLMMIGKGL